MLFFESCCKITRVIQLKLKYSPKGEGFLTSPKGTIISVLIGFNTFEEALHFANEIDSRVIDIHWKNGWSLVENNGSQDRAYTAEDYVSDLGDNYSIEANMDSLNEMYSETISALISEGQYDKAKEAIADLEKIAEALESVEQYEVVICGYGKYYDTAKKTMMHYSEDVHNYAIGVLIS